MTIHLTKFVDRVVGNRAKGARDFIMSQKDAEDLHADVTRLLLELQPTRTGRNCCPRSNYHGQNGRWNILKLLIFLDK